MARELRIGEDPDCVNAARKVAIPHVRRWKYGWFFWEGRIGKGLYKEAQGEHKRFSELIDGAKSKLGIEKELTGKLSLSPAVSKLHDFSKLVGRMRKFIYLQHRAFIPNYNILLELLENFPEDAIESAFVEVSKRAGLAQLPAITNHWDLIEPLKYHQEAASKYSPPDNNRHRWSRSGRGHVASESLFRKLINALLEDLCESQCNEDEDAERHMEV